jgi:hypothetical protein
MGHQQQSFNSSSHQQPSAVISSHQQPSAAISSHHQSSAAISSHQQRLTCHSRFAASACTRASLDLRPSTPPKIASVEATRLGGDGAVVSICMLGLRIDSGASPYS